MTYPWDDYMAIWAEAMARKLDEDLLLNYPQPVPNTFRLRSEPRPGFIDARRSDGCIPVITEVF